MTFKKTNDNRSKVVVVGYQFFFNHLVRLFASRGLPRTKKESCQKNTKKIKNKYFLISSSTSSKSNLETYTKANLNWINGERPLIKILNSWLETLWLSRIGLVCGSRYATLSNTNLLFSNQQQFTIFYYARWVHHLRTFHPTRGDGKVFFSIDDSRNSNDDHQNRQSTGNAIFSFINACFMHAYLIMKTSASTPHRLNSALLIFSSSCRASLAHFSAH